MSSSTADSGFLSLDVIYPRAPTRPAGLLPVTPQRLARVRAAVARVSVQADELRDRLRRAGRQDDAQLAARMTDELDVLLEQLRSMG